MYSSRTRLVTEHRDRCRGVLLVGLAGLLDDVVEVLHRVLDRFQHGALVVRLRRIGARLGGMQVGAQALAETEFAGGAKLGANQPGIQER